MAAEDCALDGGVDLWSKVGAFGRYQVEVLFSRLLVSFSIASVFVFNTLSLVEPRWSCAPSDDFASDCDVYRNCSAAAVRFRAAFQSEIYEWQLVCDRNYIPNTLLSVQFVAMTAGYLFGGPLSDGVGQKLTTLVWLAVMALMGFVNAFAQTPLQFVVGRAVILFAYGGCYATVCIWFMEQTSAKYSVIMNALEVFSWDFLLAGGLLAWLTAEWRKYLLVSSAISILVIGVTLPLVHESPLWLLRKGKLERARRVLERIAARNKQSRLFSTAAVRTLSETADSRCTGFSYKALLSTRLRVPTLVLAVCFFTASSTLTTIIFDLGNVGGSVYLNFCLVGVTRVSALVLLVGFNHRWPQFSRTAFFCTAFSVDAFSFGLIICGCVLGGSLAAQVTAVGWVLATAGSFFSYAALNQIVFEIYPTLARSTALASMYAVTAAANILVPYIIYLKHYWAAAPSAVNLVLCSVSLVLGLCVLPQAMNNAHTTSAEEEQRLLPD